ncbi:MAG: ribonuclease HII [Candidatus Diapherotrites archaeon]|nr:ribonuclease HII [Candidatus Diapherotrites archaeon]
MLVCGVDEAGRGPVMGPMVIAAACIEKADEENLAKMGARDSKLLTRGQRDRLRKKIIDACIETAQVEISAEELDGLMSRHSLNEIEAMKIGQMLNGLKKKPELVIVDSPDTIAENFAKRLRKYVSFKTSIRAEHKADATNPIVSAASIIAKTRRDEAMDEISGKCGTDLGTGYPHDPKTIAFLEKNAEEKSLSEFVRKKWATTQNILDKKSQKKIFDY